MRLVSAFEQELDCHFIISRKTILTIGRKFRKLYLAVMTVLSHLVKSG